MRKRNKNGVKRAIHSGATKIADTASKVESAAGTVKRVANTVADETSNDAHRATQASRPSNVIVRARDSALVDLPATIFVDPLSDNKEVYSKRVTIRPGGNTSTIAATRFAQYVHPAYQTAITQRVHYSATLTSAELSSYVTRLTTVLHTYFYTAYQRAYASNGDTICGALSRRNSDVIQADTEAALRTTQYFLNNLWMPPKIYEFIKWISAIHPLGRTPNADLAQFMPTTLTVAESNTDADLAADMLAAVTAITATDQQISGWLGKIQPQWKLNVPAYADLPTNPEYDFNWLNIWVNSGFDDGAGNQNPLDTVQLMLFNDNPNVSLIPCQSMYVTAGRFEPGIITPDTGSLLSLSSAGLNALELITSDALLGGMQYNTYQPTGAGNFITPIAAHPDANTTTLNVEDFGIDTSSWLKEYWDVTNISDSTMEYLRARSGSRS